MDIYVIERMDRVDMPSRPSGQTILCQGVTSRFESELVG